MWGREAGIPRAKIDTQTAWWETELHSEAEQAALRYAEALTRAADTDRGAAFQRFHDGLAENFSLEEILEIVGVVVNMNVWTRIKLAEGAMPGRPATLTSRAARRRSPAENRPKPVHLRHQVLVAISTIIGDITTECAKGCIVIGKSLAGRLPTLLGSSQRPEAPVGTVFFGYRQFAQRWRKGRP